MRRPGERIVDEYYARHYARVHGGGRLGEAAGVMHRALEHDRAGRHFPVTLELGAGRMEHLPHVAHSYTRYVATDLRGEMLGRHVPSSGATTVVVAAAMSAEALPLTEHAVDRVVATCLALHLPDPLRALLEWQRVCKPQGVIDFLVPCDPGFVVRAFRRLVSEPAAERLGVSAAEYRLVNALEHINPFGRVLTLARASVESGRVLRVRYFPWGAIPSWNLNAFAIFSIEPCESTSAGSNGRAAAESARMLGLGPRVYRQGH